MQSKLAIKDIYQRNDHHNYFQVKIVSHFSSKQTIENLCHAYILNKLALIPFQEDQKLTQLYKFSLQQLLSLPSQQFKNQDFVDQLTNHLCIWQERMNEFGSWPYTRAAFYSIEQKVKKRQDILQKIILKRAILEPNKQQFLNKSMSQTFKNQELIALSRFYESNVQQNPINQQQKCSFRDILFQDSQNCWKHLTQIEISENSDQVCQYLNEYVKSGLVRFIKNKVTKLSNKQLIESLKRRNYVFQKFTGTENEQINKLIQYFQSKQTAEKQ